MDKEAFYKALPRIGIATWIIVIVFSITINLIDGQPGEALNYALGLMAGLFLAFWIVRAEE